MPVMDPDDSSVIGQVVADQKAKTEPPEKADTQIESSILDAVWELQANRRTVDALCSLAHNWMGVTSILLGRLTGASPTTVIRRDTPDVQTDVRESVRRSARFSPDPIPPFRLEDYESEDDEAMTEDSMYSVLLDAKERLHLEYAVEQYLGGPGQSYQLCADEAEARSLTLDRINAGIPARPVVRVIGDWEGVSD